MSTNRMSIILTMRDHSWNGEGGWCVNLETALKGTTAEQSVWKPSTGGNSIRQLVNHINFYNEYLTSKLEETPFETQVENNLDTFGGNPAPDEADWQACLNRTEEIAAKLRTALAALTDEDWDRPFQKTTLGKYLTEWVPHDLFHTGQIVMLRRLQNAWSIAIS